MYFIESIFAENGAFVNQVKYGGRWCRKGKLPTAKQLSDIVRTVLPEKSAT
jgi:hypothetical protein